MISLHEIAKSINEDPRGVDNIDRSKGAEKKDQDADRVGRDDGDTWMAPNGDYGGKHNGEIQYFGDEEKAKVYAKSGSKDGKGGEEKPEEPKGTDVVGLSRDGGDEPKGDEEPKKLSPDEIDKKIDDLRKQAMAFYNPQDPDNERYMNMLQKQVDDLKSQKESIKVIDGKKYKAVKEDRADGKKLVGYSFAGKVYKKKSDAPVADPRPVYESKEPNKHILKENYDRFFGDKKWFHY